jgi:hypothetical protein
MIWMTMIAKRLEPIAQDRLSKILEICSFQEVRNSLETEKEGIQDGELGPTGAHNEKQYNQLILTE